MPSPRLATIRLPSERSLLSSEMTIEAGLSHLFRHRMGLRAPSQRAWSGVRRRNVTRVRRASGLDEPD